MFWHCICTSNSSRGKRVVLLHIPLLDFSSTALCYPQFLLFSHSITCSSQSSSKWHKLIWCNSACATFFLTACAGHVCRPGGESGSPSHSRLYHIPHSCTWTSYLQRLQGGVVVWVGLCMGRTHQTMSAAKQEQETLILLHVVFPTCYNIWMHMYCISLYRHMPP